MKNLIQEGRPIITAVTHTDEPGIEARVLCLVDGFAAEIHHDVNTKRQEYNRHIIRVFDAVRMDWATILSWGFSEVGHVPIHPDAETIGYLTGLSEVMWAQANVIVGQSRVRQEEIDTAQHVREKMAHQLELDAYLDARNVAVEDWNDHTPAVDRGELVSPEALDDLRAKLAGDA